VAALFVLAVCLIGHIALAARKKDPWPHRSDRAGRAKRLAKRFDTSGPHRQDRGGRRHRQPGRQWTGRPIL
jgi:hypothetical protein